MSVAQSETKESRAVCERCDRESDQMITFTAPDNSKRYVCWNCLYRDEKRINVSARWSRPRRGGVRS